MPYKTTISITIDTDIASELRIKKVNISKTVNDLMRSYLDMPINNEEFSIFQMKDLEAETTIQKAKLAKLESLKEEKKKEYMKLRKQGRILQQGDNFFR